MDGLMFGSILLSHSKTINVEDVSFLNLYRSSKRSNRKALIQILRVANSLKTRKNSKAVF